MLFVRFIIVSLFLIGIVSPSYADSQSYTATTEEECIQEQECFLYHLLWALQFAPNTQKPTQIIDLNKWEKPIRVRIFNDQKMTEELFRFIDDRNVELSGSVTQDISYEKKYNFAIILTDSIEKELTQNFKEPFDQFLGIDTVYKLYKSQKEASKGNKTCFNILIEDEKLSKKTGIYSYFLFVEHKDPNLEKCLADGIFSGFGLNRISQSPLILDLPKGGSYSRLEKLIVYLIYQDFFKSGMTYEQVKSVFFQVYPKFIGHVNQNKILSDN